MMTNPYQVVLDTNLLLFGLRSNRDASYKLLTILNDRRWQLNVSTTLIFEYEEILKRENTSLDWAMKILTTLLKLFVESLIDVEFSIYGGQ
ncbi:PIN domain-containing protein [Nostoc sp. C117]|uniref:PIN domain-containing protein n=1 Tax=Nostoc sp. C117 TaxID=3349875 RepID=UPI00370D85A2